MKTYKSNIKHFLRWWYFINKEIMIMSRKGLYTSTFYLKSCIWWIRYLSDIRLLYFLLCIFSTRAYDRMIVIYTWLRNRQCDMMYCLHQIYLDISSSFLCEEINNVVELYQRQVVDSINCLHIVLINKIF
jgi:hypothetical protein